MIIVYHTQYYEGKNPSSQFSGIYSNKNCYGLDWLTKDGMYKDASQFLFMQIECGMHLLLNAVVSICNVLYCNILRLLHTILKA